MSGEEMMQPGQGSPTLLAHDRVGKVVDGRYRIDEMLRDGAMGTVYRATQLSIDRTVALKVVDRRQITGEGNIQRFMSEARIISEMTHPNIVRLFDFGQDDSMDLLFLVMEFIEGPSLELLLEQKGRLEQDFALEMIYQACGALTDPHANGVIHRDLKPENMLLLPMSDGSVQLKVVDFGVARVLSTDKRVTAKGIICGTPWYMAPEQAEQQGEVDARADLYALGVIFYQMLCGCPPFDAEGAIQVILKQIRDRPTPLSEFMGEDELAPGIEKLIMKMLSKRAKRRPESALALRRQIEELQDEHRFKRIRVETTGDMLERFDRWSLPVIEEARQALVFNPGPPRAIAEEPVEEPVEELVNPTYGEDEESEPINDEDAAKLDEVKASAEAEEAAEEAASEEESANEETSEKAAKDAENAEGAEDAPESNTTDKHGAFLAQANEKPANSAVAPPGVDIKGLPKTSKKSKVPPPRVELFSGGPGGTINVGRAFVPDDAAEALAKAPPLEPYKPSIDKPEDADAVSEASTSSSSSSEIEVADSADSAPSYARGKQTGTMTFSPPPVAMTSDASGEIRKIKKTPKPLDPTNKEEVEEATEADNEPSEQRGTERFSASFIQTRKAGRSDGPTSHVGGKRIDPGLDASSAQEPEEVDQEEEEEQEDVPRLSTEEVVAKRSDASYERVDMNDISEEIKRREAAIASGESPDASSSFEPVPLYSDEPFPEQRSNAMTYGAILVIAALVFGGLAVLYKSNQDRKEAADNNAISADSTLEDPAETSPASDDSENSIAAVDGSNAGTTTPNAPDATTEVPSTTTTAKVEETTPVAVEETPPAETAPAEEPPETSKPEKSTSKPKTTKSTSTKKPKTSPSTDEGTDEKPVDDNLKKNLEWLRER